MSEILPHSGQFWAAQTAPAAPPPSAPKVESTAPFVRRVARISVIDNGAGLSRDSVIVAQTFRKAGWGVCFVDPRKLPADLPRVSVNVHLEVLAEGILDAANKNIVVPNPEWWSVAWTPALERASVLVWAKTADAARVFKGLGARVERVGFSSMDHRDLSVARERTFLHVSGMSPNKGTAALISRWRPDWPHLTVVSSLGTYLGENRQNLTVMQRVSEEDLRAIQNRCVFHIYPSRYEGFGHAQWEGLSCGAIVFVTDGPPFDEHQAFRSLAAVPDVLTPNQLVAWRDVKYEAVSDAVSWAGALSEEDLIAHATQSREEWEKASSSFADCAHAVIVAVDDETTVTAPVFHSLSSSLADLPPFTYVGRLNCVTGYGAAARHQVHVLRRHGLRLAVVEAGSTHDPDPEKLDAYVQAARRSDPGVVETSGTIFHLAPNMVDAWRRKGFPRPHIFVSVWETTRLPASWVQIINTFDQVWCATEWQRSVYQESGVNEQILRYVPFALDPANYKCAVPRYPDGRTVFGSVFQWTERKNPVALIGAYLQAFTGSDPVTLVLKSYEEDNPSTSVENHVNNIIKTFQLGPAGPPAIKVISQPMSSTDMVNFYQSIDCYVSAHRGEGFGLPIAEALLSGRPVIATGWSAPAEYAAGCFRSVRYVLEACRGMNWQPFYSVDQSWAHVDGTDLSRAMREARAGHIAYSPARVRDVFNSLVEKAGVAASAALREVLK